MSGTVVVPAEVRCTAVGSAFSAVHSGDSHTCSVPLGCGVPGKREGFTSSRSLTSRRQVGRRPDRPEPAGPAGHDQLRTPRVRPGLGPIPDSARPGHTIPGRLAVGSVHSNDVLNFAEVASHSTRWRTYVALIRLLKILSPGSTIPCCSQQTVLSALVALIVGPPRSSRRG